MNTVTIEPYRNTIAMEAYRNTVDMEKYANTVAIELIRIHTDYFFLSTQQFIPQHSEG